MLQSTLFMAKLKDPINSNEIAGLLPYDTKYIVEGSQYIPIPAAIAEIIINPLRKGMIVTISDRAIEKKGKSISLDDFTVVKPSNFEQLKAQEISRIYERFGSTVSSTSLLKHYMYFSTAILLAENGFLITDENREETYIKIINKADKTLLKTLEDYLDARDNLAELSHSYKQFNEYLEKLKGVETEEELEELKKECPF